jgi:hypothetical protein
MSEVLAARAAAKVKNPFRRADRRGDQLERPGVRLERDHILRLGGVVVEPRRAPAPPCTEVLESGVDTSIPMIEQHYVGVILNWDGKQTRRNADPTSASAK